MVEKTDYYLDGELLETVYKPPFSWYMNQKLRGIHELEAKVFDPAGNDNSISMDVRFFNLFGSS